MDAVKMLRNAYKEILYSPIGHWDAYVWSRTLGTLQIAKDRVLEQQRQDCAALKRDFEEGLCQVNAT